MNNIIAVIFIISGIVAAVFFNGSYAQNNVIRELQRKDHFRIPVEQGQTVNLTGIKEEKK